MEEQAIATFNHAAEEMRSLRDHEWLITNYAMIAYAALVAAPLLVGEKRCYWRGGVNVGAVVLVLLAFFQAERVLWYTNDFRDVAHARLEEAVDRLHLVCKIHQGHWPTKPSHSPWWIGLWKRDPEARPSCGSLIRSGAGEASQRTDRDSPVRPGLGIAVGLGALLASAIILSRIPWPSAVVLLASLVVVVVVGAVFATLISL
jgi:hypothetical protein